MSSEIEYQCWACGHEGSVTRAVPDVPELVRYEPNHKTYPYFEMEEDEPGEYVRHDQAAAMIAIEQANYKDMEDSKNYWKKCTHKAEAKNTELEAAWLNAEGKISDLEHKLAQIEKQEPVAVVRFDRSDGNENEMPKVVSCNWLPDGSYPLYAAPVASDADLRADTIEQCRKAVRNAILLMPPEHRADGDVCDDVIAHALAALKPSEPRT